MAAVISDFRTDSGRFHHHNTMIAGSGQQSSPNESAYRQRSRSRADPPPSRSPKPDVTPAAVTPPPSTNTEALYRERGDGVKAESQSSPSSSSPRPDSYVEVSHPSQGPIPQSSTPGKEEPTQEPEDPKLKAAAPISSPASLHTPISRAARSLDDVKKYGGNTIKVRDLAHIQSFASEEFLSFRGQSGRQRTADDPTLKYEISGMPITDIIEMVAGLLTKITTTNDRQHENLHRSMPPQGDSSNLSGLSSSVLAFHGKNVPSITILSYLSRIHKYCPTTYEVFLSLLVYFDRMTERVNAAPMQALRRSSTTTTAAADPNTNTNPENSDPDSRPSTSYSASGSDLADSPPSGARSMPESTVDLEKAKYTHPPREPREAKERETDLASFPLSHFFVVDSFNIHRLVIAGVTCASKFFSDVFYTNSRYAKVGGLPVPELNHLELQFLLLNDFRLSVPVEELEAYGTMLVEFYAREVIAQREGPVDGALAYPGDGAMAGVVES